MQSIFKNNQPLFIGVIMNYFLGGILIKGLQSNRYNHYATLFIVITLITFVIPFSAFAKTNDTTGIERLLDTSYLHKLSFDSALVSFKNTISVAREIGAKELLARLFTSRGNIFFDNSDFENALVNYRWAYDILRNYNASAYYFKDLFAITTTFYYLHQPDSVLYYAKRGMTDAQKQGKEEYIARFFDKYGLYSEMINDNNNALGYYKNALDDLRDHGNAVDICREKINIGIIYMKIGDLESARKYYLEALEIGKKIKDEDVQSSCINNLGGLFNKQKKYDSALLFFKRSLVLDRMKKDSFGIAASLNNVGTAELNLKNQKKAVRHFRQALVIAQKKNLLLLEAISLENLGDLYGDTTSDFYQINTAIEFYGKALRIAKKIDKEEYILEAFNGLQQLYALKGNFKTAYDFAQKYQVLNDTIYNRESAKQMLEIKTKYKIEQQEKELLKAQQKAERVKLISIIISLLLVVTIGILFLILRMRHLKNRKLQQQQQFVDILLENASSHVVILAENRTIKYISPSFENEFGFDISKLHRQDLFEKIHPEDFPLFVQELDRVETMHLQKAVFECRVKNDKDKYRYITGIISCKLNDEALTGFLINFWDVTRQKEYEKEVEESEKKYRSIFEAFPDIYFKHDWMGKIMEVSPSVEKIGGYTPAELVGRNISELYPEEKELESVRKKMIKNRSIHDITIKMLKKSGELFIASLSGQLIFDDKGDAIGFEGIIRDITEREKKEQQLREANETKDKLFSIIAHDLVGPIGVQKNIIDLILLDIDHMSKEEIIPLIISMKPALDATFFMIENLLSWARIMQQSIEPHIVSYPVYKFVEQIFEFLQMQADDKNIQLIYYGDTEIKALFDKNLLDIALRNLITNAMKFSPEGSPVTIETKIEGNKVKISVIDKGIGIPPDILKNLQTEKHKSYSHLGTKNEKGTGIGLIVVKEFIHKNNSQLTIESEVGKGSIFSFSLQIA